jgi:hypothetical protein
MIEEYCLYINGRHYPVFHGMGKRGLIVLKYDFQKRQISWDLHRMIQNPLEMS